MTKKSFFLLLASAVALTATPLAAQTLTPVPRDATTEKNTPRFIPLRSAAGAQAVTDPHGATPRFLPLKRSGAVVNVTPPTIHPIRSLHPKDAPSVAVAPGEQKKSPAPEAEKSQSPLSGVKALLSLFGGGEQAGKTGTP